MPAQALHQTLKSIPGRKVGTSKLQLAVRSVLQSRGLAPSIYDAARLHRAEVTCTEGKRPQNRQ